MKEITGYRLAEAAYMIGEDAGVGPQPSFDEMEPETRRMWLTAAYVALHLEAMRELERRNADNTANAASEEKQAEETPEKSQKMTWFQREIAEYKFTIAFLKRQLIVSDQVNETLTKRALRAEERATLAEELNQANAAPSKEDKRIKIDIKTPPIFKRQEVWHDVEIRRLRLRAEAAENILREIRTSLFRAADRSPQTTA